MRGLAVIFSRRAPSPTTAPRAWPPVNPPPSFAQPGNAWRGPDVLEVMKLDEQA